MTTLLKSSTKGRKNFAPCPNMKKKSCQKKLFSLIVPTDTYVAVWRTPHFFYTGSKIYRSMSRTDEIKLYTLQRNFFIKLLPWTRRKQFWRTQPTLSQQKVERIYHSLSGNDGQKVLFYPKVFFTILFQGHVEYSFDNPFFARRLEVFHHGPKKHEANRNFPQKKELSWKFS